MVVAETGVKEERRPRRSSLPARYSVTHQRFKESTLVALTCTSRRFPRQSCLGICSTCLPNGGASFVHLVPQIPKGTDYGEGKDETLNQVKRQQQGRDPSEAVPSEVVDSFLVFVSTA